MKLNLCRRQRVLLRGDMITFCHRHFNLITLNRRQFDNLHDMIRDRQKISLQSYPLGGGVWIERKRDSYCITSCDVYFLFYPQSWRRYIRQIHRRIRHILHHHGRYHRDQYDADVESEFSPEPRRLAKDPWWKTLPRSPRNATPSIEQRQKRATLSPRNHSNSRLHQRTRCREDATRDSPSPMSVDQDSFSDKEYGSDCSISEPESTQHCK